MAIKELFQDSRPQVLLDPRASQRIDPRFKFTRNGTATYYDSQGVVRYAPANQPRVMSQMQMVCVEPWAAGGGGEDEFGSVVAANIQQQRWQFHCLKLKQIFCLVAKSIVTAPDGSGTLQHWRQLR
jgi:hypothetical protein